RSINHNVLSWLLNSTSRPASKSPAGHLHPPRIEQPLRIQIEGPLKSIQKLLPSMVWETSYQAPKFPQAAGLALAELAFWQIYGVDVRPDVRGDMVVRDEYMGWVRKENMTLEEIDYYGVTFDHLVPLDDVDPEVLQINIIEMDDDDGEYANKYMSFSVNASEYTGKRVLAVPRCCQKRKGTQDRQRVNESVLERDGRLSSC
ncbi:arginine deiminase type-3, partial [Colletotrichum graminicola]